MTEDEIDESNQLLVVIVDVNPNQLMYARHPGSFSRVMNSLLTFMNSHLMLHASNRLLAISSTGDSAAQYINYMNSFFTAQKLNIPVDCCMLGQDSGLLQQGCDITGGVYLKVEENSEKLLEYLIWMFLPCVPVRKMLGAPPPIRVDYRNNKLEAELQCHKERESKIQEREDKVVKREAETQEREEKVVKKEKTLKNKQKAQNKRDKTLKERETSLQERERSLDERAKTLKQAEKELEVREKALTDHVNSNGIQQINKAVAKGFQDLPPEIIAKIMSYCSTADKKEMRCVSKWCFILVSTASKKLKLLFGTYTIKDVDERNYPQISKVLSNAVKRSYGPEVRLDLQLITKSTDQMREILTSYKENIVSMNLHDPKILLQPHLEFINIKRLDISFNCDEGLHKNICEAILARYGDKLEHLGIRYLTIPNNTLVQVPHLSKLKSLTLNTYDNNIVNTFVNAVNKENITHLSLCWIRLDTEQLDTFIFPKLQHLELVRTPGESALALIKYNKDTIRSLMLVNVNFRDSDIGDIKIPNLQYLELYSVPGGDVALSLIKCNKDTITKLIVSSVHFTHSDIEDIKIPKLQYLELLHMPGDVALSMIKNNKDTITKLKLWGGNSRNIDIVDIKIPKLQFLEFWSIPVVDVALSLIKNNKDTLCEIRLSMLDFRNTSLPVVEMPRLRRLYLLDATSELKVIKAFGRNIEELWSFDKQKFTREELNNLKLKALALQ